MGERRGRSQAPTEASTPVGAVAERGSGRDAASQDPKVVADIGSALTEISVEGPHGSRTSLLPPEFEGRYEPRQALGEGGMGAVTLFHDRQIGRSVAVKEILPELAHESAAKSRFIREARVQGQLEHPAVVPVYDMGVTPQGAIYFSMKRIRGVTLATIIEGLADGDAEFERTHSRRKLLTAFASVCLAVDFAHERGVLHRDLKPANIMLGDFGEVYVLDWGVAKIGAIDTSAEAAEAADETLVDLPVSSSAATHPGTVMGTPGYLAPEQLVGEETELGPASDVYALGTILFELLTLQQLQSVSSMREAIALFAEPIQARASERAPERDIPPELDAICVRATAFDPKDRYRSARELQQAIDRYLEGERDVAQRSKMAQAHASKAGELALAARSEPSALEERRQAMREIGRSLALDPANESAMNTLVDLMTHPPQVLPPEVVGEMDRSSAAQHRATARIGAIANVSLFLYVPLVMWMGLRDARSLWLLFGLAAVCAGLSAWTMRSRRPRMSVVTATMILSNVMYACTWPLFGPLVLLPTILVANTMAFAIQFDPKVRGVVIAVGCLAVLVPVLLEAAGVVSASYHFSEAGMLVLPGAVELNSKALVLLCVTTLAAIVTGSLVVSRVRVALHDAERQLYLYAWHLREFVPQAARPPTDPTRARRKRRQPT